LWDYFGQANERAEGIKVTEEERVDKPKALTRYEQIQELHIPYVDGGLMDQPYLWMQQHGVIKSFLVEWNATQKALAQLSAQGQ